MKEGQLNTTKEEYVECSEDRWLSQFWHRDRRTAISTTHLWNALNKKGAVEGSQSGMVHVQLQKKALNEFNLNITLLGLDYSINRSAEFSEWMKLNVSYDPTSGHNVYSCEIGP